MDSTAGLKPTRMQQPAKTLELSVVVPTFNERLNVAIMVARLEAALAGHPFEVIFVDDDSPDGTAAEARRLGLERSYVRCIKRVGRRGLAGATIEGMLAAQAPIVAVIDGDLQHDETQLVVMLQAITSGRADIVIGSRYIEGGDASSFSKGRLRASQFSGALAKRVTGLNLSDPMSGFFMAPQALIETLAPDLSTQGFKILLDILATAKANTSLKLKTLEIPYAFKAREFGESKLDSRTVIDFFGLLAAKASGNMVSPRFVSFVGVGASGVLVHLMCLTTAIGFGASFTLAQMLATLAAMTSNFYLNNAITYRDQRVAGLSAVRALFYFYLVCSVGSLSNLSIATWIYANQPVWWLAGLVGSIVGAVWNYALSSLFVWRSASK